MEGKPEVESAFRGVEGLLSAWHKRGFKNAGVKSNTK
jgi:hypothetical protein